MSRKAGSYQLNVNLTAEQGRKLKERAKQQRRSITAVVVAELFPKEEFAASADPS